MGNKKYKDTHKMQGKCTQCNKPIQFPFARCRTHTLAHRKRVKMRYDRYVKEGKCVTCGRKLHPDVDEGKRKCLNCREK